MAFDQQSIGKPLVDPAKKTTKVNLWMAAAVVLFFGLGGAAVLWMHHHADESSHAVQQDMAKP